jgi:hypothetical protein
MTDRRTLIATAGFGILRAPLAVARMRTKVPILGILHPGKAPNLSFSGGVCAAHPTHIFLFSQSGAGQGYR